MVDFGQTGALGGVLAAQQMRNEQMKTEVERGQLGIQLQELTQKRQKMMLDVAQNIATSINAEVDKLEAQFYREAPFTPTPDMKVTQIVQGLMARKSQINKILGMDDEFAAQDARGLGDRLYRAMTADRQQVLSAGQGIFEKTEQGYQLKAAMPTAPSDFEKRVGIARGLGASPEELKQMAIGGGQPSASRFRPVGPYIDAEGKVLGEGIFDGQTGQTMLRVGDKTQPMPADAKPATESSLSRNVLTGEQFIKFHDEVRETEQSVRAAERYLKNIKNSRQGFGLLADQFVGQMRTLFGEAIDKPEQMSALMRSGQLQGLIGRFRKEVVGGGVMTEQDALRIIARLGGEGALANKQIVAKLMRELVQDKVEDFNTRLMPAYNQQIKEVNRGAGFKEKKPIEIDEKLFGADETDILQEARDAIAKGASRDAVIKRLREQGIDPEGL